MKWQNYERMLFGIYIVFFAPRERTFPWKILFLLTEQYFNLLSFETFAICKKDLGEILTKCILPNIWHHLLSTQEDVQFRNCIIQIYDLLFIFLYVVKIWICKNRKFLQSILFPVQKYLFIKIKYILLCTRDCVRSQKTKPGYIHVSVLPICMCNNLYILRDVKFTSFSRK